MVVGAAVYVANVRGTASLWDALIERVRNANVGEIFYWCQGLCDYYK